MLECILASCTDDGCKHFVIYVTRVSLEEYGSCTFRECRSAGIIALRLPTFTDLKKCGDAALASLFLYK